MSKILIVDDNEAEHFLIENVIEEFDSKIEVLNAYDGEEALKIFEAEKVKPDLILLDINMPGMNGYEFLEEYEKRGHGSTVIAMLTSSELGQDREFCMGKKIVKNFISKPLSIEDLKKMSQS